MFADFDPDDEYDYMGANVRELEDTIGTISAMVEELGGRYTWRQVRGLRHATDEASRLIDDISTGLPPQSAGIASEELGIL